GVQVERLADAELLRQLALLELDADALAQRRTGAWRVEPEHRDRARVGRSQAGDRFDGGGLAGAVRAEDGEDLALLDVEGDAVDGDAAVVGLDDVVDFDDVHGPSIVPGRPVARRPGGQFSRRVRWRPLSTERLMPPRDVR